MSSLGIELGFQPVAAGLFLLGVTPADVYEDGLAVVIPKWQKWARAAKKKLEQAALERKAA